MTGTRYVRGGGVFGWNFKRKLTSRGANYLAATLLRPGVCRTSGNGCRVPTIFRSVLLLELQALAHHLRRQHLAATLLLRGCKLSGNQSPLLRQFATCTSVFAGTSSTNSPIPAPTSLFHCPAAPGGVKLFPSGCFFALLLGGTVQWRPASRKSRNENSTRRIAKCMAARSGMQRHE